jgi:hypothetical protein
MRTRALRVTVGAYENHLWHVTLVADSYERGVLVNSELLTAMHAPDHLVELEVVRALHRLMDIEAERLARDTEGAGPEPSGAPGAISVGPR